MKTAARRSSRGVFLASLVLLLGILAPPAARAISCPTEETRFVEATGPATAYGSWNNIDVKDHDIAGCTASLINLNFFATSRIANSTRDRWVEVGYSDTVNASGQEVWRVWYEGGFNFNQFNCGPNDPITISPGPFMDFRVGNNFGANTFDTFYNAGSGWMFVHTCSQNFAQGFAQGETGRYGGTATGASDDHKNLKFKEASGTWTPWSDNVQIGCGNPCISNWHYFKCTNTRYKIIKDGQPDVC